VSVTLIEKLFKSATNPITLQLNQTKWFPEKHNTQFFKQINTEKKTGQNKKEPLCNNINGYKQTSYLWDPNLEAVQVLQFVNDIKMKQSKETNMQAWQNKQMKTAV